ncbi:hypothetical protein F4806DRAFT_311665 [Annulohypoxylon nitens]|nr:hypothetical protein F4806DRAFT_311665 [Annulohypoxylon nitens]
MFVRPQLSTIVSSEFLYSSLLALYVWGSGPLDKAMLFTNCVKPTCLQCLPGEESGCVFVRVFNTPPQLSGPYLVSSRLEESLICHRLRVIIPDTRQSASVTHTDGLSHEMTLKNRDDVAPVDISITAARLRKGSPQNNPKFSRTVFLPWAASNSCLTPYGGGFGIRRGEKWKLRRFSGTGQKAKSLTAAPAWRLSNGLSTPSPVVRIMQQVC